MGEKTSNWVENKAIGNNAENIVEFLINSVPNWKCLKYGMENHINDLREIVRKKINPTTRKIKSMPDFVAFNSVTGETFFVEVKHRSFIDRSIEGKSEYKIDFLDEYLDNWKETKLIIVHGYEPYFFVVDLRDVKRKMCRKKKVGFKKWEYYWDFAGIQKSIKDLFPEMSDEIIKKAIKLIPKK